MRQRVRCVVAALLCLWGVRVGAAQAVSASDERGPRFLLASANGVVPIEVSRTTVLARRLRLNLEGATLRQALAQIARQSGLQLVYGDDLLPLAKTVHLQAEAITTAAALTDVLFDTGVDVVFRPNGSAALVKRPVPPPLAVGVVLGRVLDAKGGHGLESVELMLEGTRLRTQSGPDGRYRLAEVPVGNYTITARRIGYQKRSQAATVVAGAEVTVDFSLDPSALNLDEVIVTGTAGSGQLRAIGNSVTRVAAAEVRELVPATNVGQLINGRAPGVVVLPGTGMVGGGPLISIRGSSSFSLLRQPLLYVDGARVDNAVATGPSVQGASVISRLNDINPADIESIEIIKGPAAATLYGTEASNGVIQIITKKGVSSGKPQYTFRTEQGGNWFGDPQGRMPTNYQRDPATQQILQLDIVEREDSLGTPIFHTGHTQSYGLSVVGGSPGAQYYLGGGFDREEGAEVPNVFRRASGRASLTLTPSPKFDINASLGVVSGKTTLGMEDGPAPITGAIAAQPTFVNTPRRGFFFAPPEAFPKAFDVFQGISRFTGSVRFQHRLTGWLNHALTAGYDKGLEDNEVASPRLLGELATFFDPNGSKATALRRATTTTLDYHVNATAAVGRAVSATTSAGIQYYHSVTELALAQGSQFPVPGLTSVSAAAQVFGGEDFVDNVTVGFFAQEQVALNNRLFLTGAVRADDNSAFGQNFDLVYYPKASLTWVVSEEPFWKVGFVDALKLRAAYGAAGQQPQQFANVSTYLPVSGHENQSALTPGTTGNPDLRPERGEEFEVGFEAAMFRQRVSVDVTYYHKDTRDAILSRGTAPSSGFSGSQFFNAGRIRNSGLEALVRVTPIASRSVGWDLSFSIATNSNEVVDLGGQAFIALGTRQQHRPGYPVGGFFGRVIVGADVTPAGQAVNLMCDGGTGANGVDQGGAAVACGQAPALYLGASPVPKYEGSVSSDLTLWNRLRVHTLLDFKTGHRRYDNTTSIRCVAFQICEVNYYPERYDPVYVAYVQNGSTAIYHNFLSSDASFAKIREVSLSYDLPTVWVKALGASRGAFSLAARNLHTWTSYTGLDPENMALRNQGTPLEQAQLPQLAQFRVGLNLTF